MPCRLTAAVDEKGKNNELYKIFVSHFFNSNFCCINIVESG
jgi:hypothetical protein